MRINGGKAIFERDRERGWWWSARCRRDLNTGMRRWLFGRLVITDGSYAEGFAMSLREARRLAHRCLSFPC